MKTRPLAAASIIAALFSAGCDKTSPATERKLAELERQAADATRRQQELEKELTEQKLAAERDAIERERMRIEQDRAAIEREQGEAAAAAAEALRRREAELASREGKVELLNSQLETREDQLDRRGEELNEKDRELAGREALESSDQRSLPDDTPAGDYRLFYESLSPYGSWFETPDYGYVWQPAVVRNGSWRPYMLGRWACTDRGWTWMSDEPFGWAAYHYGRWALCRGYGWVWVPGSEWAPSWVCWRSSGSHVGWAPLPPETLAYRGRAWDSSVEVAFGIGSVWFNFVETRNFCEPIHHHCIPYTQNDIYIRQTVNITHIHVKDNRVICGGPTYGDISRQTKRKPPFYRIEEDRTARPGRGAVSMQHRVEEGRLRVARPVVTSAWDEQVKPREIKGRIETFDVDRKEPLKPEVRELVQKTREQNRKNPDRKEEPNKPDRPTRVEERPVTRQPDPNTGNRDLAGRGGDPRPGNPSVDPRREATRDPGMPKTDKPSGGTGRKEESDTTQQEKNNRVALELQDELRRKNDKVRVLPKNTEAGKPDPLPRPDERNDKARNEQQEQEKQREMARQRQVEAQREAQRETERQQRAEEARREQQRAMERQQQREAEKQQQRMEEARREQQRENERQQRREAERQQQQMEEARRQQQREAERQQERMEESRREQQREAERQQERSRQQRSEEEQRGRGKNR